MQREVCYRPPLVQLLQDGLDVYSFDAKFLRAFVVDEINKWLHATDSNGFSHREVYEAVCASQKEYPRRGVTFLSSGGVRCNRCGNVILDHDAVAFHVAACQETRLRDQ
jgi:hypothetical protein